MEDRQRGKDVGSYGTCDWAQSRSRRNVSPARRSATRCRRNNALPPLTLLPVSVASVASASAAPVRGSKGVAGGMCR